MVAQAVQIKIELLVVTMLGSDCVDRAMQTLEVVLEAGLYSMRIYRTTKHISRFNLHARQLPVVIQDSAS